MIPLALLFTPACKPELPCGSDFSSECQVISGLGCYDPQQQVRNGTLQGHLDGLVNSLVGFINEPDPLDIDQCVQTHVMECGNKTVVAAGKELNTLTVNIYDTETGRRVASYFDGGTPVDGFPPECNEFFTGNLDVAHCVEEGLDWLHRTQSLCARSAPCDLSFCSAYAFEHLP